MMMHSVVLLNGETGGFIVADGSIKPIPKIGDGLRRHLMAVNTLAQALEGGDDLDSDHSELEALVVQAANLVLRRLERSAGMEPVEAPTVVIEPEQVAEPHDSAEAVVSETVAEAAPEGTTEPSTEEAPPAEASSDAEPAMNTSEASEPVETEAASNSNGEHLEQAMKASTEETQTVEVSSEVEPEKKLDGNHDENPQTDLEPIPAAEGEQAHGIEASS
jgi:hypothetical protein